MRFKCKMIDVESYDVMCQKCGSVGITVTLTMNNVAAAYATCCVIVARDVRCGK